MKEQDPSKLLEQDHKIYMGGLPNYLTGRKTKLIFRGGREKALRVFWIAKILQFSARQLKRAASLEGLLFLRIRFTAALRKGD
jgi:hypothetical protein